MYFEQVYFLLNALFIIMKKTESTFGSATCNPSIQEAEAEGS
jgi:hypothetical protein